MGFGHQIFDYFLVLDFEATCVKDDLIQPHQEIIEFPVVKLCAKTFAEVSRFHSYVKPTERPILTSFCTDLTGIVQEMVENQESLPEVLKLFDKWLNDVGMIDSDHHPKCRWTFLTCGDWDLGVILRNEAKYRELKLPDYFNRWINIKKAYCGFKGHFAKSLPVMLKELNLKQQGRLHSGIDDVLNICRIARHLAAEGHIYQNTTQSRGMK